MAEVAGTLHCGAEVVGYGMKIKPVHSLAVLGLSKRPGVGGG